MPLILLIAAAVCEIVATILGFRWLGTTPDDYPGWLAAGLTLYILAGVVPDTRRVP